MALTWAVGGTCTQASRDKFDQFLKSQRKLAPDARAVAAAASNGAAEEDAAAVNPRTEMPKTEQADDGSNVIEIPVDLGPGATSADYERVNENLYRDKYTGYSSRNVPR